MDTTYTTTYDSGYTTSSDPAAAAAVLGVFGVFMLIYLAIIVVMVISMWKLYSKAHKPGWASLIPIYNIIVMLEIIGRPLWWIALMLVPVLNIWIGIVVAFDLAKAYGKSTGTGVLVWLLPIIGYPVLAFSKDAQYVGPVAAGVDGLGFAPDRPAAPGAPAAGNPAPAAPAFTPAASPAVPTPSAPNTPPVAPSAPEAPSNDPGQPTPPPLQ